MTTEWMQKEFNEEREDIVRALSGMIFSWDQNGHLFLRQADIGVLVAAVELLKRADRAAF